MSEPTSAPTTGSLSAADWATERGERWRAQITGLEAMIASLDEPLIHALRLEGPCRIADVGCGGGGTTLELFRRAPAGSTVHGFDVSPVLVEVARARKTAGMDAVAFEVADVATFVPETPYDRLTSRFGVMFFDDPAAAFANLFRWLAPGGRFAFAVWGRTSDNPWMRIVRDAVAEVIDVPRPDPEAPSPFRYAEVDKLLGLVDRAGFTDVAVTDWRGELPVGGGMNVAEATEFALSAFSSFGGMLAEAGEEAVVAGRQVLRARLAPHQREGAVWMDAGVHLVTGARSG